MKKVLLTFAVAVGAVSFAVAQESEKASKFEAPKAGTVAFGIDATPFLNYAGNFFGKTANNTAPTFDLIEGTTFYGKYFLADDMAVRGKLSLGYSSNGYTTYVPKSTATDPTKDLVEDKISETAFDFYVSGGIEKRFGKGRLQGFYGAELGIGFGTHGVTAEFGEALSATNTDAVRNMNYGPGGAPALEDIDGTTFTLGVNAFLGAEYFVTNSIAVGGELGWGINLNTRGRGSLKTETWDGSKVVVTDTEGRQSTSRFGLGNFGSNFGGQLNLTFYF